VISILIVDDHTLVRDGLRVLLDSDAEIEIAGEAATGEEAVEIAARIRPDVVLMDISMPGIGGLEATRRIVAQTPGAHVLILTTFESEEHIFEALRGGASGFLVKDSDSREVLRAVRLIARGDALLSPAATRRLIDDFATRPENRRADPQELEWLTPREREVMALVAAGLTNEEIARQLVISGATAKTHVSRAMRKLHCHDRAQLVVLAYETGLVFAAHRWTDSATDRLRTPAARLGGSARSVAPGPGPILRPRE
jgi:DNA-binding NarL/FixJ family response regulator